jgi:hypothetical protein
MGEDMDAGSDSSSVANGHEKTEVRVDHNPLGDEDILPQFESVLYKAIDVVRVPAEAGLELNPTPDPSRKAPPCSPKGAEQ